jgi:hypothetical protein
LTWDNSRLLHGLVTDLLDRIAALEAALWQRRANPWRDQPDD